MECKHGLPMTENESHFRHQNKNSHLGVFCFDTESVRGTHWVRSAPEGAISEPPLPQHCFFSEKQL